MERESFENEVIAEILNREYVCVKVDREERPDVDSVYMSVCQAMNGQGGWPLTIIMTPDCRPFFSGTYFPPRALYGRPGLEELLTAAADQWKAKKDKLLDQAGQIEKYLRSQEQTGRWAEPELAAVHQAFRQFADSFDRKNGGFGSAPKFPTPHSLIFLMEYGARQKRPEALAMAETTLVQMYRAVSLTTLEADFPDIPRTDSGWCPILRKCSTTTACWSWLTSKPMDAPGGRCMDVWRERFWNTSGRSLRIPRAAFTADRTRTAMVWKENTMCLPRRR